MDSKELNQELKQLHLQLTQQLQQSEGLTPQNIKSLQQVSADIQSLLAKRTVLQEASAEGSVMEGENQNASTPAASTPVASTVSADDSMELPAALQAMANQFSVEHPQLADVMNRLGYVLSNIGI